MNVRRAVAGIGRACIASGVLILLFVAYQLWGTGLAEAQSQDRLRSDFLDALESSPEPAAPPAADPAAPATTAAAPRVVSGDAVAIIRIPKIEVEKAVVEGVSVAALKEGPGHYPSTPLPGQPGNAAVAGHRTTYGAPFLRLDELGVGDDILVTTSQGEFTYRVSETVVVDPSENDVLNPTEDNRLTLTTCHPRYSARQRLIVTAMLQETPAPAPPPPPPGDQQLVGEEPATLAEEASVSGEEVSKTPAILWGLLAGAIWFVTWLLAKRWGRLTAYAMGVPVFGVVLFVFFENFARLLPANV